MNEEEIERLAYRLIRKEVRRFDRVTTDGELANYVRGVVDLQTELYGILNKARQKEKEQADKCTYEQTGCGSCKRQLDCPIEAYRPKRKAGEPLEENDSGYNCENWIP